MAAAAPAVRPAGSTLLKRRRAAACRVAFRKAAKRVPVRPPCGRHGFEACVSRCLMGRRLWLPLVCRPSGALQGRRFVRLLLLRNRWHVLPVNLVRRACAFLCLCLVQWAGFRRSVRLPDMRRQTWCLDFLRGHTRIGSTLSWQICDRQVLLHKRKLRSGTDTLALRSSVVLLRRPRLIDDGIVVPFGDGTQDERRARLRTLRWTHVASRAVPHRDCAKCFVRAAWPCGGIGGRSCVHVPGSAGA